MEFVELKKHIRSAKPFPCYYCYGDDDFVLSRAVAIVGELAKEPKIFNLVDKTFDTPQSLADELSQLPVMSEYRVVVVRGKYDVGTVDVYLKNPNPFVVLVIVNYMPHDSWAYSTAASPPSGAAAVCCNRLDVKYVIPFVRKHTESTQSNISDDTVRLLYDRCGGYMTRINAESQKLALLRAGKEITEQDVGEQVKADTEFVVFDLCKSIIDGNPSRALEIADGMAKNNDVVAAFTMLYNRFKRIFVAAVDPDGLNALGLKPSQIGMLKAESARIPKVKLKKILDMLAEADFAYKTGAMSQQDALTSFIARAAYAG